jgi:hypothetical protein
MIPTAYYILWLNLAEQQDVSGIYGGILDYAIIFSIVGSALLAFLYFWSKGRLDMDEEPKMQMMNDSDKENTHEP